MRRAVRVLVLGKVQGVGYRAFVMREAKGLGFDGWVRNLADGTVEAVLAGEPSQIERMLVAMRVGPPASRVATIRTSPYEGPLEAGFRSLPTV